MRVYLNKENELGSVKSYESEVDYLLNRLN